jgi:hypothetical protein
MQSETHDIKIYSTSIASEYPQFNYRRPMSCEDLGKRLKEAGYTDDFITTSGYLLDLRSVVGVNWFEKTLFAGRRGRRFVSKCRVSVRFLTSRRYSTE